MALSHATEKTPTIFDHALNDLTSTIHDKFEYLQFETPFEEIEKELHTAFIEAEKRILIDILAQYDIDLPFILVEAKEYRKVIRCKQTYMTSAGSIHVERSLYREKNSAHSICPLELRTGMIEGRWSPRAAKQALLAVSQTTPYEAADFFRELGAMQPSKSSLDRLPKKLSLKWEENKRDFETTLRHQDEIPDAAVSVSVSLDGVLVPIQGNVVIPGDSRYEEASCGSLTYYDAEGEPLKTRRYGCMPEHKKVTLKTFLSHEVNYALTCRPDLQLVKVADGAKDNWTFLDGDLPKGIAVLDFYHAAEHLKKAFEIIYGVKSIKSGGEFLKYRSILRHDKRGIHKVISHLTYLVKKHPLKKLLKTELNYFKNNKKRCEYLKIDEKNLPIGSGIVEATCKTLVSQRLKRSGMCWREKGGQAILTFRGLLQSKLFNAGWSELSNLYLQNIKLPENVIPFRSKHRKIVSG